MATLLSQVPKALESKQQAEGEEGGYGCEFVELVPSAFQTECPVCLLLLREPYQTTCCGKSYCRVCIEKIKAKKLSCPTCKESNFQDFPNKGLQQPLYQFKVRCTHHKEGCKWTGELGALDSHLNLDTKLISNELLGCDHAEINCRYKYVGCKARMTRHRMKSHMASESAQHLFLLEHQYKQQAAEMQKMKAENFKLREEISTMDARQKEEVSKVNETWLKKIQTYFLVPPVTIPMTHFGYYHENTEKEWLSPPFYTDYRGYKLCLRAIYKESSTTTPGGTSEIESLSLQLCLMQGEFDNKLKWPFDKEVEVEVISQTSGHANKSVVIYHDVYANLPVIRRTTSHSGYGGLGGRTSTCVDRVQFGEEVSQLPIRTHESEQLIPVSDIHKFVKNDRMEFRIVYAGPKRAPIKQPSTTKGLRQQAGVPANSRPPIPGPQFVSTLGGSVLLSDQY